MNLVQIYATYSMMTGLLSTIAVGILLLLIVSVIVITIVIWFPGDQEDHHNKLEEVRNKNLHFVFFKWGPYFLFRMTSPTSTRTWQPS